MLARAAAVKIASEIQRLRSCCNVAICLGVLRRSSIFDELFTINLVEIVEVCCQMREPFTAKIPRQWIRSDCVSAVSRLRDGRNRRHSVLLS